MALDNVTSHFSTMLETIASASFLSSLSLIHGLNNETTKKKTNTIKDNVKGFVIHIETENYLTLIVVIIDQLPASVAS